MGVEVLLVVGGEAQASEPPAFGVALRLLHQRPAVAPPPLPLGHDHRLDKQAAAKSHDPGQTHVAQEPLRPSVSLQQNQTDGELRAGLLKSVDPGRLAPRPLGVDQVRAGDQQVRTVVDRNRTKPPRVLGIRMWILLNVSIRHRAIFLVMVLTAWGRIVVRII